MHTLRRSDFDTIVHEIEIEIININDDKLAFSDVIYKWSSMIFGKTIKNTVVALIFCNLI